MIFPHWFSNLVWSMGCYSCIISWAEIAKNSPSLSRFTSSSSSSSSSRHADCLDSFLPSISITTLQNSGWTSHLTDYPRKTSKICWALLKKGQTHKRRSTMNSYIWSLPYYLPMTGERIVIHTFRNGISVTWNANNLIQDLNSGHRVHILQR